MNSLRFSSLAFAGLAGSIALTGCGPTLGDLPLPGSGVSGDTVEIKADFDEALNLAKGATVKVNGVDAGKVQSVTAKDFRARAVMKVQTSAHMRQGATVRLRYTTPLGELFVDVRNPATGAELTNGALVAKQFSSTAPTVEDALASASLLVNGGGLAQLQVITSESNKALKGREDTVRSVLDQSNTFITQANATSGDIDRTLNALGALSVELKKRDGTIRAALRDVKPAAAVLRANTAGITKLLAEVEKFSSTANGTVNATRAQLLILIRESGPVLAQLASTKSIFAPSLVAVTKLAAAFDNIAPGDYLNMGLRLDVLGGVPALEGALSGVQLPNVGGVLPSFPSLGIPGGQTLVDQLVGLGQVLGGTAAPKTATAQVDTSLLGLGALLGGTR